MKFAAISAFWFLIPWALLPLLWIWLEKRAAARLALFASAEMMKRLVPGNTKSRRKQKLICFMLASLFAILALARPQMGVREENVPSQGLDIVFLLDVSNSMLTEDVVPSRMKKAKHIIRNFSERLAGDRIGVVTFAGSAYPAIPMTSDYDFVRETLDILDEKTVTNQGTDLGRAIQVAVELLDRGSLNEEDAASSRVLVVLSDGEDHEGSEAELTTSLKERGLKVYTIGVGTEKGGPIPVRDLNGVMQNYKRNRSGEMVLTKLEMKALESLASKTSAKSFIASTNEGEVEEILNDLTSLDRSEGAGRRVMVYEEYFQFPLFLSILFLFLAIGLREVKWAAAVLILITGQHALAANSLQEYHHTEKGIQAFEEKDYAASIDHFSKSQASDPQSMTHHMNLGDAFLKSGAPDRAIPEFEKVLESTDLNEAARGAYNLGKSFDGLKNHDKALGAYQKGLEILSKAPTFDHEIAFKIKRAMEESQNQKQGQSSQQDQKSDSGKGGEQDQKPKDEDQKKDEKEDEGDKKDKQKDKEKQYKNPKREFKAEKLSESDAKRILKQLQEQEKQTQQRVMRMKNSGKRKEEQPSKDW